MFIKYGPINTALIQNINESLLDAGANNILCNSLLWLNKILVNLADTNTEIPKTIKTSIVVINIYKHFFIINHSIK